VNVRVSVRIGVAGMTKKAFEVEFDHFQFMIGDKQSAPLVDTSKLWDKGGPIAVLPETQTIVGVATVRFGGKVLVHVAVEEDLSVPGAKWIEVGPFELFIPSGRVIIFGPESEDLDAYQVLLPTAGKYDGTLYNAGTERVVDEMSPDGEDEYYIVLSPHL